MPVPSYAIDLRKKSKKPSIGAVSTRCSLKKETGKIRSAFVEYVALILLYYSDMEAVG
ncbi:hypothetical protein T458_06905 [Brevibacillus panacihumi W25]|uniref:Uncharacterized protein n=1 Tax=Brevibacillus panacihumi W25 TaxID=1408254 RepID=V6MJR6_9BACL|nr:hypothetical protein T458_06905 [Brevibacillus panacihumi W25]